MAVTGRPSVARAPTTSSVTRRRISRHVETIRIGAVARGVRSPWTSKLPSDARAVVRQYGDRALYCLPLTTIQKFPALMSVDLRDEDQRTQHLMTRQENAEITEFALLAVIHETFGVRPSKRVRNEIARLVYKEGDDAQFGQVFVATWLSADAGIDDARARPRRRNPPPTAADLALNTLLWVPLTGLPRRAPGPEVQLRPHRHPAVGAGAQGPVRSAARRWRAPTRSSCGSNGTRR